MERNLAYRIRFYVYIYMVIIWLLITILSKFIYKLTVIGTSIYHLNNSLFNSLNLSFILIPLILPLFSI